MYWFTGDEHFGHSKILEYCERPFKDVDEMDEVLIKNFNEVVKPDDTTIHIGDFTLKNLNEAGKYWRRLNGEHIFLVGSHDYWQEKDADVAYRHIWEKEINGIYIVASHYPFKSWPRSFHGSVNLHGHCHGKLPRDLNQMDVGVDANKFYPINFIQVIERINLWNKTMNKKAIKRNL